MQGGPCECPVVRSFPDDVEAGVTAFFFEQRERDLEGGLPRIGVAADVDAPARDAWLGAGGIVANAG